MPCRHPHKRPFKVKAARQLRPPQPVLSRRVIRSHRAKGKEKDPRKLYSMGRSSTSGGNHQHRYRSSCATTSQSRQRSLTNLRLNNKKRSVIGYGGIQSQLQSLNHPTSQDAPSSTQSHKIQTNSAAARKSILEWRNESNEELLGTGVETIVGQLVERERKKATKVSLEIDLVQRLSWEIPVCNMLISI